MSTRRNSLGRKLCAVHVCPVVIEEWQLMCPRHWFKVPQPMRAVVWRALRAWQEQGTAETLQELTRAQINAIREAS